MGKKNSFTKLVHFVKHYQLDKGVVLFWKASPQNELRNKGSVIPHPWKSLAKEKGNMFPCLKLQSARKYVTP